MEIVIFSFISALGLLLVLTRTLGLKRTLKIRKILDVIVTFGVPILFTGTFSGMITAFFTGLWFTLLTCLLQVIVNPHQYPLLAASGSMVSKKTTQTVLRVIVPLALDVLKCALTRYTFRVLRDSDNRRRHQNY